MLNLELSPEEQAAVKRAVELLEDTTEAMSRVAELVTREVALPLLLDAGGVFALRTDGAVLAIDWCGNSRVVNSQHERDVAIVAGARRYDFLQRFVPSRGPADLICKECGGTGVHPLDTLSADVTFGCACGGLGFIPATWELGD